MQQAPIMKGSGLKPLDDSKSSDKPVHIFGSNLEDRIVNNDDGENSKPLSFGSIQETREEDDIDTIRKRKFDAITGEEDEETIFQGEFKLFAWDLETSNWIEKGRGQLKLNDSLNSEKKRSRIIMRVGGTHRIVLNVAIRHNVFRVIASTKTSIRFTDSQSVWAASGSNASQLGEAIEERIKIASEQEEEVNNKKPKTNEKDLDHHKKNDIKDETKNGDELGNGKDIEDDENDDDESKEKNISDHENQRENGNVRECEDTSQNESVSKNESESVHQDESENKETQTHTETEDRETNLSNQKD